MGKYKSFFVLILIIFISFTEVKSHADVLVYGDAVIDSIRHSANIGMKIEDIRISDAQYRENFAGLYPTINIAARAERYENIDRHDQTTFASIGNEIVGGNESAWKTSTYIMGQYYLSHWYKKRFETAYYEKLRDSSVHQCEAEAKKVIRDVTEIFGTLLEAKIKLKYATGILNCLYDILKIKKEAFTAGHYSYEDVLKAESDAVNMEKDIAKIKKEISEISLNLSGYTGSRYTESTEVEQLVLAGYLPLTEEKMAIAEAPEYKARQKEMEAIRNKEKAATFGLLPDVSIYGRYDLYNSSPDNLDNSFRDIRPVSYSVGLLISLPLFDGGAKFWARKRSTYEIRKQEENIRATYEEKKKDIKTLQAGYDALAKQCKHYKKLNEQYEKMQEISKKAYDLGERSKIDILELEKDALTMERDLKITEQSMAIYEKQFALELDYNKFLRDYNGNWACRY
ncbi:hypothetical protein A2Y85_01345 [candidate division WOR-3 bacterium RBG_13_43_14]|uniref:Transporter n=1 Tax=candidate division WOR-3 bacterium RBG_13_43_14 TaxID=1802590 RepID=A0A1F4UCD7_UNCW3|nr:MAG: hypothetical protein A2Y85_01345 [candidate division WOR-3 bacterium RBG_13_43_14]